MFTEDDDARIYVNIHTIFLSTSDVGTHLYIYACSRYSYNNVYYIVFHAISGFAYCTGTCAV